MAKKAEKRLASWDQHLFELREFCFYGVDDFDEWAGRFLEEPMNFLSLSRASKFFHLDAKKPAHRELLLGIFADILFGKRRRGRPARRTKWNVKVLEQLWNDLAEVKEIKPEISDAKAAQIIKNKHRDRYRHTSPEMLRQRLGEARGRANQLEKQKKEMAEALRIGDEIRYVAARYYGPSDE
jgi:hypothetical protein